MNHLCLLYFRKFALVIVLTLIASSASADIVFVSDDTSLLTNGTPTAMDPTDGESSFGGRSDVILGFGGANPSHGLFRFDVSSLATQINDPALRVVSAQFLINEIDSINFDLPAPATFGAFPVVATNSGWVEGVSATSTSGFDGDGNASFTYHTSPTGSATNTDGQLWHSAGGGPTGTFPTPNGFTFGVDTGASLGSGSITALDNGINDELAINLNPGVINSLLSAWLLDPTGNAGIAIQAAGSDLISFESVELGGAGFGRLDVTFATIPEPTSVAFLGCFSVLAGLRRRRR